MQEEMSYVAQIVPQPLFGSEDQHLFCFSVSCLSSFWGAKKQQFFLFLLVNLIHDMCGFLFLSGMSSYVFS